MWDIKACAVCFITGVKLHSLDANSLRADFNKISGLTVGHGDGLPNYLCVQCTAYVRKFKKFREKCQRAYYTLTLILSKKREIKIEYLEELDLQKLNLQSNLSHITKDRVLYDEIKHRSIQNTPTRGERVGMIPKYKYIYWNSFTEKTSRIDNELEDSIEDEIPNGIIKVENQKQNGLIDIEIDTSIMKSKLEPLDSIKNSAPINKLVDSLMDDLFDNTDFPSDIEDQHLGDVKDVKELFNEQYGKMVALTVKEARAVVEIKRHCSQGKHVCKCGMKFTVERALLNHLKRHDVHVSGEFACEVCDYHYKTDWLLQQHRTDKHLYKYLCKECPHVSFNRTSAKQHFIVKHIQEDKKIEGNKWDYLERPAWLRKEGNKNKGPIQKSKAKAAKKIPKDFIVRKSITHEDQYLSIQQRKESRNYIESKYKCEYCYRGYRFEETYNKHMAKHDMAISGKYQCDMCKLYFRHPRKLYSHMINYHLHQYCCTRCVFTTTNQSQALNHYRWHKNVTYDCPHCNMKFSKISTKLTHIRFKHPSNIICNICGHSFVSDSGLNCHKQMAHTPQEIELSATLSSAECARYCAECDVSFMSELAYATHYGTSNKHVDTNRTAMKEACVRRREGQRPSRRRPHDVLNTGAMTATTCDVCGKYLSSDVAARAHYSAEHPGTPYNKRYMCHVCGHITKQYANLVAHMRVHTREKPYACPHCDRTFSMPSNRDRHLVVHTGEKKYSCQHCNRRFTQSTAVKLHIQTVHLKIPYKPWDKKNRRRRKEQEPTTAGIQISPAATQPPAAKIILGQDSTQYITYITYTDDH